MYRKIKLTLFGLFFLNMVAFAQSKITGVVLDDTGQPLPSATVQVARFYLLSKLGQVMVSRATIKFL
jgi:hypothetical protein